MVDEKKQEIISDEEKDLLKSLNSKIGQLGLAIQRGTLDDFSSLMRRPWKFFFLNFFAGIFRGVGIAIGMTIVAALIVFVLVKVLHTMVDLPIIGMYVGEIIKFADQYLQNGLPMRVPGQ